MKKLALFFAGLLLAGCATGFKPVDSKSFQYLPPRDTASGLKVEYRNNVLDESQNARYAAKARMHGLSFVAVKVTNTLDRPLGMERDVEYRMNGVPVLPVPVTDALPVVRQRTGAYAFYFLLALLNASKTEITCDGYGCQEDFTFIPIGLILGPAIAIGNMTVSSGANQAFAKEFNGNDLFRRTLQPGETATGYLAFRAPASELTMRPRP